MGQAYGDKLDLKRCSAKYAIGSLGLHLPLAGIDGKRVEAVRACEHYWSITCGGPQCAAPGAAAIFDFPRLFNQLRDLLQKVGESVVALLEKSIRTGPLRYIDGQELATDGDCW